MFTPPPIREFFPNFSVFIYDGSPLHSCTLAYLLLPDLQNCTLSYWHTCIPAYVHTYIIANLHTFITVYLQTAYLQICILEYLHTYKGGFSYVEVEPTEAIFNPATSCSCNCAVLTQPLIGEFHHKK